MEKILTKEKIIAFDAIVRGMNTAIKNSALYSPAHPVFAASIWNLKKSFDDYFISGEDRLEIGVSQKEMLLNGEFLKEKSDVNEEMAEYLHRRGIMALVARPGVAEDELEKFVSAVRIDDRNLRARGGILSVFEQGENFRVKVIDYSAILAGTSAQVTPEDRELWKSLCSAAEEGAAGAMKGLLISPERAASTLNRIYKEAVSQFEDGELVEKMRGIMGQLAKRAKESPAGEQTVSRKALEGTITRLEPALIVKIFESSSDPALAADVAREMSDEMVSDLLGSLAAKGAGMNERLIKLFSKMVPDSSRTGRVSALLADNILNMSDKETRARILGAIKNIFGADPGNDIISAMYKFTVDRLPEGSAAADAGQRAGFRRLTADFKESLKQENVARERVMLILNILYIEKDPGEFGKLSENLAGHLGSIVDAGDTGTLRCVFELFIEKMKKRCSDDPALKDIVEGAVAEMSTEGIADRLISMITDSSDEVISDISYLFMVFPDKLREKLIEAFLKEKDPFCKEKFLPVFSRAGKYIAAQVAARVTSGDTGIDALRELLKILRITEHGTYRVTLLGLTGDKNPKVRVEAYRGYLPTKSEEIDGLFEKLDKENDESVREMILEALIRTRYWEVIDRIFKVVEKNWRSRKYLLPLVKFCGDNKIVGAVPYLGKIIFKREIFGSAKSDELKVAAVVSLGQIHSPEAAEILKKAAVLNDDAVKKMCEIVLRLDNYVEKRD